MFSWISCHVWEMHFVSFFACVVIVVPFFLFVLHGLKSFLLLPMRFSSSAVQLSSLKLIPNASEIDTGLHPPKKVFFLF